MSKCINRFLLAGHKFMPEMHLKQPRFTYSACGPFTKNNEKIKKFIETGNTSYIYKIELDRACFQHDMAFGDFKDLAKRTAAYKILRNKPFNIAENPMYDGYQRGLASMVYKFFDKKPERSSHHLLIANNKENMQLANFITPLLENLKKEKHILHLGVIYGVEI